MTIQHKDITEANLHEPKGVSTASTGEVYFADGSGSGAWAAIPIATEFGEIYIEGGSTSFTVPAASAYAVLNPTAEWVEGNKNIVTTTPASGILILTTAGTYAISFWCTFTTAALASNLQYYFKYALDGTPAARKLTVQKNTGNADTLNCSASGILVATAGQTLGIHVAGDATTSNTAITVLDAGLNVWKIKD